ncbi:hypothetical protein KGP17_20380 [Serratia sp. JSRIV001]|nr:hypothetical protein KGP17_20380 [Serratia sp. JSRIV001]
MKSGVNFDNNHGPVTILNKPNVIRASVVGQLVEILSQANSISDNLSRVPAEIDLKINFNDLKRNRWIAELYKQDSLIVDESIRSLDLLIPRGSEKLKRQMKGFYKQALGRFSVQGGVLELERVKVNSDNIIDEVIKYTRDLIDDCSNINSGIYKEDIDYGIQLIVSYSIIECVILENPNDHN